VRAVTTTNHDWRTSRRRRVEVAAIAAIGTRLVAALGWTLRWRVQGIDHLRWGEDEGRRPIMAFWHGRILPATYYFRGRGIVVITSENFDGEWIARIIQRFGFGTARGSTSRGAQRALLQLKRDMAQGHAAGFTVDGPRGPARRVQPGVVWLSKVTGNPVVPFHLEASRHWTVRSWDRTQIPRPFSTVAIAVGTPITVAPDAGTDALEAKRLEVEQSLYALEGRTLAMLGEDRRGTGSS
jgi:lysophospholipid acyltransferase (LPLAT)-like uncharacterized protein